MTKTRVCICGGGNLAHVTGGWLASRKDCEVSLLTRTPSRWADDGIIRIADPEGKVMDAHIGLITSKPELALKDADLVLLCLPGFAIADVLHSIVPYIDSKTAVGSIVSSTGFFPMAQKILPQGLELFGFQRVPFIARINEYGHSASLLGYKDSLSVATFNSASPQRIADLLAKLFEVKVNLLGNPMMVTLTNSNPLLHPSRLFGIFGNGRSTYDKPVLFYEEWDNFSSQTLIDCDSEFRRLLDRLEISRKDIPSILDYYESHDAQSLTDKIRSIKAFKGLYAPMVKLEDGKYGPDWNNRYFTEDIPFGLLVIKSYASKYGIETPTIDKVLKWAQKGMDKEYLVNGRLAGRDLLHTVVEYITLDK